MIELLNIDCRAYMATLEDKAFDLAIVDPPYGIGIDTWDNITDRPAKKYWEELFRISENQIVFGGNYFSDCLPITKSWIVWDKTIRGKSFLKNRSDFELIWTSLKTTPVIFNYTIDGNIEGWDGGRPNYKKLKAIHSAQKPVKIYEFLLKHFANEGDNILDTHGGSMSIAIACHQMGFDLTLCEIDKDYYEAGVKRYVNAIKQQTLFSYDAA